MGFTTLVIGHLNILTITFVPFSLDWLSTSASTLITRYEEELRNGQGREAAIHIAIVFTGPRYFHRRPDHFRSLSRHGFDEFKGIQEMGIICGGGMLLSLIPMMTLFPATLLGEKQRPQHLSAAHRTAHRARLEQLWLVRPRAVLIVTTVVAARAAYYGRNVFFDYNLLNMQSKNLPAVVFEEKLIKSAEKSVLFAAVVADTKEEAVALEAK